MYNNTSPTATFLFNVIDDYKLDHGKPPDKIYVNPTQFRRLHKELQIKGEDKILELGGVKILCSQILNIGYECL